MVVYTIYNAAYNILIKYYVTSSYNVICDNQQEMPCVWESGMGHLIEISCSLLCVQSSDLGGYDSIS